jgi:hypothetical protein
MLDEICACAQLRRVVRVALRIEHPKAFNAVAAKLLEFAKSAPGRGATARQECLL